MKATIKHQSLALQGQNKLVQYQAQDNLGRPIFHPATGKPVPGKVAIGGALVEFSVDFLRQVKGRLFYVQDVIVPVVNHKQPIVIDLVEVKTEEPITHPNATGFFVDPKLLAAPPARPGEKGANNGSREQNTH